MRQRFRLRQITVVADRGIVSQATLNAFEGSDPPVRYIVGVRMRRQKEVRLSVLGSRRAWFESVPERIKAKDPAPLKIKARLPGRPPRHFVPTKSRGCHPSLIMSPVKRIDEYNGLYMSKLLNTYCEH
jgi:hypothetical protein